MSSSNKMMLLLTAIALVPFSLPTLFLLGCGMAPTFVAAFVSRRAGRAWMSVGGLNFAGLSYWLLLLWFGHHTMDFAVSEILSVTPLLVAYAGAGVGWLLHMMMAPVVGSYLAFTSQRRISQLVAQQRKLVELWGEEVITRDSL